MILTIYIFIIYMHINLFAEEKWQQFTSTNSVNCMVMEGEYLWIGTQGGLLKFNKVTNELTHYNNFNSGLLFNNISAIAIDKFGNKWIGTRRGLHKFDNSNWTLYNIENSLIADNIINSITIDSEGDLWIGHSKGVSRFDGENWKYYFWLENNSTLKDVRFISINSNNKKWFYTKQGLVELLDNEQTVLHPNDILAEHHIFVTAMAIDSNDNLWLGTSSYGALKFDGTNWEVFNKESSGIINNNVKSIIVKEKGNILFGTNNGISEYDGNVWQNYNNQGEDTQQINSIIIDKVNLWLGTANGISKFFNDNWKYYSTNTSISNNSIRTIYSDNENNKWFVFNNSIDLFDELSWKVFLKDTQIDISYFNDMKIDHFGNKWIATSEGIIKITPKNEIIKFTSDVTGITNFNSEQIEIDSKNNLYIKTSTSGIVVYDGINWTTYSKQNGIFPDYRLQNIAIDKDDVLWVCLELGYGLYKFDGQYWTNYNKDNSSIPDETINKITPDNNGNIWLSTYYSGVVNFDGTNFTSYTDNTMLNNHYIRDIAIEINGDLWVVTYNGLFKFNDNEWTEITIDNSALPDNQIYSIEIDKSNNVWFGTNSGVAVLTRNESGIEEDIPKNHFTISPNPARDYMEITIPENQGFNPVVVSNEIAIYNMLGERVANVSTSVPINRDTSASGGQIRIDISHLSRGVYFVRIGDRVEKFVKK